MRRVRGFAVLFVSAVVLLGAPARSWAATVCESALPFNIDAGTLEPVAITLLQQSSTFRQQCERIAATLVLRVEVRIARSMANCRAETVIRRYESGALRAQVVLSFGDDYVELLAHELEHVLEQVEQVSLARQLSTGEAWMTPAGAFETARAQEAGSRVRRECDPLAAESVEANRRAVPRLRDPLE